MRSGKRALGGFTYFVLLFAIAVIALGASAAVTSWHLAWQRDRELQLIDAGREIRAAIERYVVSTPSGKRQYPRTLDDLVRDPRFPGTVRHLRRVHADPFTGRADWALVRSPDGGVMGVHSTAGGRPLKTGGFRLTEAAFEGAESYRDWLFAYRDRHIAPR